MQEKEQGETERGGGEGIQRKNFVWLKTVSLFFVILANVKSFKK